MNEENPNYYAVIPANVRYDKNLSANAKLFYGEITALSNKNGCCWASNKYFSDLYGLTERQISRIISELEKNKYIKIELIKEGALVKRRNLYIIDNGGQKCLSLVDKNVSRTEDKNVVENNTSISNNTSINNKESVRKHFQAPTLEEIQKYCIEKKLSVNPKKFFDYFNEGDWIDAKGNKVKNWKQKLLTWEGFSKNKVITRNKVTQDYSQCKNKKTQFDGCPF